MHFTIHRVNHCQGLTSFSLKLPAASGRGIIMDYILFSPQGAGNITHEILRLRSGSVRLINFVLQNQSLTD